LDNNLTKLLAPTFLGGSSQKFHGDSIGAIAMDANGKVYVGGGATSSDFPLQGGLDAEFTGDSEAFDNRQTIAIGGQLIVGFSRENTAPELLTRLRGVFGVPGDFPIYRVLMALK
jgi:hypothetical protein